MASGVVVLGMHRSGTSAITRILNLLGADIGPKDELLTEHDNPSGHWENKALIARNDEILASFGRSWDFPPWLAAGWERSERASALVDGLSKTFAGVYETRPWVWKDPRTCLTFPLWRRVLGPDVVVLLVFRRPEEVVVSLNRRDGMPRFYGTGLWLHYVRLAVGASVGLPVLCRHFEDLVESPTTFTEELAEDLRKLGLQLEGDVAAAAASVRQDAPLARARSSMVDRLTASTVGLLDSFPAVSDEFAPASWSEPRWVRPALTAYRLTWAARARTGHPLRPGAR